MKFVIISLIAILYSLSCWADKVPAFFCHIEAGKGSYYEISVDADGVSWLAIKKDWKSYRCPLSLGSVSEEKPYGTSILDIEFLLSPREECQPKLPKAIYKRIHRSISFSIFEQGNEAVGSVFLLNEKWLPLDLCEPLQASDIPKPKRK